MSEQSFFQKALRNFVDEFANGDLIRQYAEKGYSIKEIYAKLDFPTPMDRIHELVWKHFLNTRKILMESPEVANQERYQYVKDVSAYGKISYRRVKVKDREDSFELLSWQETTIEEVREQGFSDSDMRNPIFYAEITFGLMRYRNQEDYRKILHSISPAEADYIDGLFTERSRVYYKLDHKMIDILFKLHNKNMYDGKIYQGNQL